MKEIVMNVKNLNNGNEVYCAEISACAFGRTWESARKKAEKELRGLLKDEKKKTAAFSAVIDIKGATELEQENDVLRDIQTISMSF